nr:NCS2 family permease [Micromonospora sp. DSM 115978]
MTAPPRVATWDRHFQLTERGSTLPVEVLGGVSTFLALSYIVVVNPAILAEGGVPREAAFFATAVLAGLATIAMGVWARLPFAVAPGMEMNALVAFSVIGVLGFTWQEALGLVFWSGIAMIIVTVLKLRQAVIDAIPAHMRVGLAAAVGVFIGLIGLQIAGIVTVTDGRITGLGSLTSTAAIACYLGLAVALAADRLGLRIAVLASIAVASVYAAVVGLTDPAPIGGAGEWLAAMFALDLTAILDPRAWSVVLVLFALDFFGSVAKVLGLSARTTIVADGTVPGMREALLVDGTATTAGAVAGSTSYVAYVESAVGIRAGARTGIASVVTGLLLIACLVATPVLTYIPVQATTGALLFVAVRMVPSVAELRAMPGLESATLAVMVLVTVATSAIDQAMLAGFLMALAGCAVRRIRPNPVMVVTTVLLTLSVVLQYISG